MAKKVWQKKQYKKYGKKSMAKKVWQKHILFFKKVYIQ